jgi:hypothetical protein
MCITPLTIRKKTKDMRNQNSHVQVPCGKCPPCLKRKASHWSFRLNQETKVSSSACFITLTYETPPLTITGAQTLKKKDFQDFLKRLRKTTLNKLKYYACGEYGGSTIRPHYHAIMFNLPQSYIDNPEKLEKIWTHGHIHIVPSNQLTIAYVSGYVLKGGYTPTDEINFDTGEITPDSRLKEFSLMSKKMGLNYLTPQMRQYYKSRKIAAIIGDNGNIKSMPRYFKDKIFTKQEKHEINEEWKAIRELDFNGYIDHTDEVEHKKQIIKQHQKEQRLKRNLC